VINIMSNNAPADGQTQDTATVLLLDATGKPVTNTPVTFTVGTGATLVNSTCTTNAYGACTVGLTATAPGGYPVNATAPVQIGPATATFVGAVSQANSSLVMVVNNQPANNVSQDQAQVTLRDSNGNPVGGQQVTFNVLPGATFVSNAHLLATHRASPGSSPTTPVAPAQQISCTTDSAGVCTVGLTSATPDLPYAVTTTAPVALGPVNAIFGQPVPGAPSAATSSLTIAQNNMPANGVSQDLAQVTLRDANSIPVPNVLVAFTVDTGATLVNSTCMTGDGTNGTTPGVCTVGLTSTTANTTPGYGVSATAGSLTLGPQPAMFIAVCSATVTTNCGPAAPDASKSTLAVTMPDGTAITTANAQPADGASPEMVTVTLRESSGQPGAGVLVPVQSGVGSTLTSTTCVTDANGVCAVGVTSTVAGAYLIQTLQVTGNPNFVIGPVAARFVVPARVPPPAASTPVPALDPRSLAILMALLGLIALRGVRHSRR
jgi:hypothetical protein